MIETVNRAGRNRGLVLAGVMGLLLAGGARLEAAEPRSLAEAKAEIREYVQSGGYERDIAAVVAEAEAWLEQRAKMGGAKLAVVFDLDETLLSNWPEMNREDLGFEQTVFKAWIERGECPPIESVRGLYGTAKRLGLAVIYLTGRTDAARVATEKNLRAIGCDEFAALICRPEGAKETSAAVKAAARAKLEAEGYTIIANLGDQQSDLTGGHAERTFKLPNPFYLTK